MPTDSPAHRETATVRGRGRRRPGRRLPPARGARPRRCGSAWRPSAPPPAGTGAPEAPLHVQLPDGADLHDPPALEDRTAERKPDRLVDVLRLDDREAADDVLGLGVWPVGDGLLLTGDRPAGPLQRVALVLEVPLVRELLHPRHPGLHALLHPLRRSHRRLARLVGGAIQVHVFTHDAPPGGSCPPPGGPATLRRWSRTGADILSRVAGGRP